MNVKLGFAEVLFVVFLVLKLTNEVHWSWWWVTAPLWIAAAFTIVVLLIAAVVAAGANKALSRFECSLGGRR